MNVLKQLQWAGAAVGRRTYATMFVPPASLEHVARRRDSSKPLPESPNIYTGRPSYYDQLNMLETALQRTQHALRTLQLLPLPAFAREAIPPPSPVWKNKRVLADELSESLTVTRYRRIINLLNQLDECRRIADVAGVHSLAQSLAAVLEDFEPANKEAVLARGKRKPVKFDEYGRSYTVGRRKESTARVWVIAVQDKAGEASEVSEAAASSTASREPLEDGAEASEDEAEAEAETSQPPQSLVDTPAAPIEVTTTNILINNTPLSQYLSAIVYSSPKSCSRCTYDRLNDSQPPSNRPRDRRTTLQDRRSPRRLQCLRHCPRWRDHRPERRSQPGHRASTRGACARGRAYPAQR